MPTISERIEKAAVELAQARERFESAQRDFDALLKLVSESPKVARQASEGDEDFNRMTRSDQVMALLNSHPKKAWSYPQMQERIPDIKLQALRVLIYNLKKRGKVTNEEYGLFKAV